MIKALEVDIPADYKVLVETTEKRGFTPEEVAERCADRIIQISDTAHLASATKLMRLDNIWSRF